jgi:hypothetical protein
MSVIPATQEVEIGKIAVGGQPRQKKASETPSQPTSRAWQSTFVGGLVRTTVCGWP